MIPIMKVKVMYFQQGEGKEGEDLYSIFFLFYRSVHDYLISMKTRFTIEDYYKS